jgi:RNA polymerase sigma factor for flagellar operon FliA
MVSHQERDGGDFLSPHGRNNNSQTSQEWARDAMLHYKKTGCPVTRESIVLHYMDTFVHRLALQKSASVGYRVTPEDLKQDAFFALNNYIDKFEPSRNYKFESFARLRIEGAMLDFLRREDPASRLARSRSKMISNAIELFRAEFGRRPTEEELQVLLQLDEKEFLSVMRDAHVPCTISFHPRESENDDDESNCAIHIESKYDCFESKERQDLNSWLFQQLGHYDILIVTLTYCEGLTMLEIGHALGFSESRVSQRLKHAHNVIKGRLLDYPDSVALMAG